MRAVPGTVTTSITWARAGVRASTPPGARGREDGGRVGEPLWVSLHAAKRSDSELRPERPRAGARGGGVGRVAPWVVCGS